MRVGKIVDLERLQLETLKLEKPIPSWKEPFEVGKLKNKLENKRLGWKDKNKIGNDRSNWKAKDGAGKIGL